MLGPHKLVVEGVGLFDGSLDYRLRGRGEWDLAVQRGLEVVPSLYTQEPLLAVVSWPDAVCRRLRRESQHGIRCRPRSPTTRSSALISSPSRSEVLARAKSSDCRAC